MIRKNLRQRRGDMLLENDKEMDMINQDWTGNLNSVWKTIGASNHSKYSREADDYYATDPIAIDKLLKVERPNQFVWECACGGGHLSERLYSYGYDFFNTDIKNRGYINQHMILDFLAIKEPLFTFEYDILTNPPYKFATEFIFKALDLLHEGCKCFMFLKITFLEGKRRYTELFRNAPPRYIYVFSERVLCAKNAEFERMRAGGGSAVAYAWFVWQKGYAGATEVRWI